MFAVAKLTPRPPALVLSKNRNNLESGALKASIRFCLISDAVEPSNLVVPYLFRAANSSSTSSVRVICEKSSTRAFASFSFRSILSSKASLPLPCNNASVRSPPARDGRRRGDGVDSRVIMNGVGAARHRVDAVTATTSCATRSERPQNRKSDHPPPALPEATRVDGVSFTGRRINTDHLLRELVPHELDVIAHFS